MEETASLYLDLTKKALTFLLYGQEMYTPAARPRSWLKGYLFDRFVQRGMIPMRRFTIDRERRKAGLDWPPQALTMIGMKRLDNLQYCLEDVLRQGVPGDVIEAGTWRGGAAIFLRAVLKAHGIVDRVVWVADSFAGLPDADESAYPADAGEPQADPFLAVPLDTVKLNFSRFGLLDDQVRFVQGWFSDTLPRLKDQKWSLIRADGDMYESTMETLKNLYPNLSVGGYIVIDDFGLPSCREAVNDFRDVNQIREEIRSIDTTGVYWRREA